MKKDDCTQYIHEIRFLFPSYTKQEKAYVNKLKKSVLEYIEESGCSSKEELYQTFGKPEEVVMNYYSSCDFPEIIHRLRIINYIKKTIAIIMILVLCCVTIWGVSTYHSYKIFKAEQATFKETMIH